MSTITKEEKLEGGRRVSGAETPPEGGWGWMIVAACFLATVCTRAVTRCVSIFFVEFHLHFEKDYSTTAWIHSMIDSITMICAPVGGFLGNHLSCRATVILGGMLSSAGLVLSSFASSLEQLYICMGFLTGLGFALGYTPAVAMVGMYFSERKALAYGIALSGSGIGTFIMAPAVQLFIECYSWRGALLVLGGFVSNLCVCGALMRSLQPITGGRVLKSNMGNLEKDCMTTLLDCKDTEQVSADGSQIEQKQLEMNHLKEAQGLLIANERLKNFGLENNKLCEGNIGLPDLSLTEQKIAECILFSNKLTVLGKIECSDPKIVSGRTVEDLKLVESMNLNNKANDIKGTIENSGLSKDKSTDKTFSLPSETFINTKTASRRSFFLRTREEFGFLALPSFLVLSVSFLFLAYGCSTPVALLVPYALSLGMGHQQAAFLISIFGVSGIVGNITFGWITDRKCLKRYRMLSYMLAIGMEGLCCLLIPLLHSFSLLAPFSVIYGYFDGAYVALIPVVTSDVVGSTYLASALGVVYFLHGIPYLVSPPIGGWLVDRTGDYEATFFLSGVSFIVSAAVLAASILVRGCRGSGLAQLQC